MLLSSIPTSSTSISPAELRALLNSSAPFQLVDVRTYPEFAGAHIAGASLVPLDELSKRLAEIHRDGSVVLMCRSGKRSAQARETLLKSGFEDVCDLSGGILAWQEAGFPVQKQARASWSLERQVRVAAGLLALLGAILGFFLNPWFFFVSAFVGAGLILAGVTEWCGMGFLLARMPWNRARRQACESTGNSACCSH